MRNLRPAYVVGGKRVPFAKSMTQYLGISTQDLMVQSLRALVSEFSLEGQLIGDVALGAVMNSAGNWSLARECVLSTSLSPYTPAYNVQRACGSSLEAAWQICLKISSGSIQEGIAGGVDTNSDLPIEVSEGLRRILVEASLETGPLGKLKIFSRLRLRHLRPKTAAVVEPRTGMSMGQHCEKMVKEWQISREEQDQLALRSHQTGAAAFEKGFYKNLVVPMGDTSVDRTLRGDTSLEKLSKLKPAFDRQNGSLTAGNSSPLTDGSSAVLLASEGSFKKFNWTPLARFVDAEAAAVDFVKGDGLLMAPTIAVSRLLARNKLELQDFDFYEIHEAFAGQVLCTLKAWQDEKYCQKFLGRSPLGSIDLQKMNVVGGSVALGHPFAATGTRIVASLSKLLSTQRKSRGLISICTAGGMGIAAILESVD